MGVKVFLGLLLLLMVVTAVTKPNDLETWVMVGVFGVTGLIALIAWGLEKRNRRP